MAQEGWIKLYRVLTDDDDWNSEPFTIGQAFIDILLRVNHKDGYWKDKHIKRGQMWTSKRKLMERWNVGYTRTQRFLNRMVESEKIFIEYAAIFEYAEAYHTRNCYNGKPYSVFCRKC